MTTRAGSVISRVARTAGHSGGAALTDGELLRRFAEANDEPAFAAVVARHGPMVLGTCRRLLPSAEDAEDACQATFLLLVRKAGVGRWQASVANWLYTTARRVAARARRDAERRARREARAAAPEAVPPLDAISGRELLALLDEELGRLPARYREPLVLCYLQGLSRDEAATQLAIPAGTVKTRLERGRRRLGAALAGRGVAPGAGLLALASGAGAGANPPRLTELILAAVCGSPPPAVAALARGAVVNVTITRVVVAVVVAVSAGGLGVVWGATRPADRTPDPGSGVSRATAPVSQVPPGANRVVEAGEAAARRKAIKFLMDRQAPDGTWESAAPNLLGDMEGGATALVVLSLLEAGVSPADPAVKKAVAYLAKLPPKKTYVVSLQTRVLAAAGAKAHAAQIQSCADWLVAGGTGLKRGRLEGWGYGSNNGVDNSNTHFAVFGLHAASEAGAKVDDRVWAEIRDYYVRTRTRGGWSYQGGIPGATPTYSMTAGALSGLAVADRHSRPTAAGLEAFEKGMAALLAMPAGTSKSVGYQWLVTAELGRSIRSPVFKSGDKEVKWYRDGVEKLVTDQRPDGSWVPAKDGLDGTAVLGTAFGLYFLGPPPRA